MNPSREDIRIFDCPACGARASKPCVYTGKRSASRMAAGKNHYQRLQVAQRAMNRRPALEMASLIDEGDAA